MKSSKIKTNIKMIKLDKGLNVQTLISKHLSCQNYHKLKTLKKSRLLHLKTIKELKPIIPNIKKEGTSIQKVDNLSVKIAHLLSKIICKTLLSNLKILLLSPSKYKFQSL